MGSGKSGVARLLTARGVPVVDADLIARGVVMPGRPALREIEKRFPGVVGRGGALDSKARAARVSNDASELAALNAIVHPRVAEEMSRRMSALADAGRPFAVYEAALIGENGLQRGLDGLIVVTAPEEAQIERLRRREGMSEEEARARIAAQLPAAEKARQATFVIDNHGREADLAAQVDRVLAQIGPR